MGYLKRNEDGSYTTTGGKEKELIPVRVSKEDNILNRAELEQGKYLLEQSKDSTALKQLAKIGLISVLHDEKIKKLIEVIFDNKRKNRKTGIVEFEVQN